MDRHAAFRAARRRRALRELSERSLDLARDLHDRMLAAQDTATVCKLADAFVEAADGVRRAIELEARLRREERRAPQAAPAPPARVALPAAALKRLH